MSSWKDLPKPATPGPWHVYSALGGYVAAFPPLGSTIMEMRAEDGAAIAALPEWIEEAERLRAWLEWICEDGMDMPGLLDAIRAGEWPEGRSE